MLPQMLPLSELMTTLLIINNLMFLWVLFSQKLWAKSKTYLILHNHSEATNEVTTLIPLWCPKMQSSPRGKNNYLKVMQQVSGRPRNGKTSLMVIPMLYHRSMPPRTESIEVCPGISENYPQIGRAHV